MGPTEDEASAEHEAASPAALPASRGDVADHVLAVRQGHGANCSSIGSVLDTLFAAGTVGVAVFAMVAAALRSESVQVVGEKSERGPKSADASAKPSTS